LAGRDPDRRMISASRIYRRIITCTSLLSGSISARQHFTWLQSGSEAGSRQEEVFAQATASLHRQPAEFADRHRSLLGSTFHRAALRSQRRLLPHFHYGATLSRNGGSRGTKAHPRPMDGIVANAAWSLEQWVTVYRLSGSSSPMDQPCAVADWLCSCSARSVAGVWAVDGLQRKAFWEHSSGVFPVVPGWCHRFFLGCTAHPRRVRNCSASRAAGAGFYFAGQRRAFCFADPVVLRFSSEGAAQSSSTGFLSRILVTLLQPRVTRHRKLSTGI
jgi:hypothetical protein